MGLTLEQAKALKLGDVLQHEFRTQADGSPQSWEVVGQPQEGSGYPYRVSVSLRSVEYPDTIIAFNELNLSALDFCDA